MFFKRTETVELQVEGMTCAHCEQAVKRALESVPGVQEARASASQGTATVKVEPGKVDWPAMARAIQEAGYRLKD